MYQVTEIINMVDSFYGDCNAMIDYIKELLELVGSKPNHNLFEYACVQGTEMRRKGEVPREMKGLLTDILKEVQFQHSELQKQCQNIVAMDFDSMEKRIEDVVSKEMTESEKKSQEEKDAAMKRDVLSLKNSMNQVIEFAALDEETAEKLRTNVDYLVKASDRLSIEDESSSFK